MAAQELNLAIARALGLSTDRLKKVTLTLEPGRSPLIEALYTMAKVDDAGHLITELARCRIETES